MWIAFYSNAGFIFFGTMLRMLAQQREQLLGRNKASHMDLSSREREIALPADILDSTAGIILDSAPARLNADIASRQATEILSLPHA